MGSNVRYTVNRLSARLMAMQRWPNSNIVTPQTLEEGSRFSNPDPERQRERPGFRRGQKTGHLVIRQMHAVWPLIHQNCDRSIRSSVGNMLCHFFHDKRIADQKAHDFRRVEPGLLTQNRAVIEFHEHHQPRPAEAPMDHTFQFSKGPCAPELPSRTRPYLDAQ